MKFFTKRCKKNIFPRTISRDLELLDQFSALSSVLFEGYFIVSRSYMKSREEQINEKITILEKLRDFAHKIISTFEPESIVRLVEREVSSVFGVKTFLTIFLHRLIVGAFGDQRSEMEPELARLVTKSMTEASNFFVSEQGEISTDVDKFQLKRIVTVVIRSHGLASGVLALYSSDKGLDFTSKDLNLLHQFIYLIALALENASMVGEIHQSRQETSVVYGQSADHKRAGEKTLSRGHPRHPRSDASWFILQDPVLRGACKQFSGTCCERT